MDLLYKPLNYAKNLNHIMVSDYNLTGQIAVWHLFSQTVSLECGELGLVVI